jgi:hypothetical protein
VGIATGYGLDDRRVGVRVLIGSRIFISLCCPDRLWGPPNLLFDGCLGEDLLGHEANHPPPTSAEVKKFFFFFVRETQFIYNL